MGGVPCGGEICGRKLKEAVKVTSAEKEKDCGDASKSKEQL